MVENHVRKGSLILPGGLPTSCHFLRLTVTLHLCCRDSSSVRLSPTPEEDEEEEEDAAEEDDTEDVEPTNNAEGTGNWLQATAKKGRNKKKKSKGGMTWLASERQGSLSQKTILTSWHVDLKIHRMYIISQELPNGLQYYLKEN